MIRRRLIFAVALLAMGCQHSSPTYNRYTPAFKRGPVLKTADDLVDSAQDALDIIDQRVENAVY